MLKLAVVREGDEPLAIEIQSPGRVDIRRANEIRQRRPAFGVGKLAEHPVGLVQQNDERCHLRKSRLNTKPIVRIATAKNAHAILFNAGFAAASATK